MPRGSAYTGPSAALEKYLDLVDGAGTEAAVKGAKNPYTSRNGHMFSFLDSEGTMALRLSDEMRTEFLAQYGSGPVMQYGSVMRGYVSVPSSLLDTRDELSSWFAKSYHWIGTLEPKPTKK
ncbi:MAG: TfoX/Sxy family protein [bacterium]|nr:TfoX/Sxy family protein [bacterium]